MKISQLPSVATMASNDTIVHVASPDSKAYTITMAQFKAMFAGSSGTAGGYYTPSLSSAGVLSWSASKSGMNSVTSRNIKGDTGPTGYSGSNGSSYYFSFSGYTSTGYTLKTFPDVNVGYWWFYGGIMVTYLHRIKLYDTDGATCIWYANGVTTGSAYWSSRTFRPFSSYVNFPMSGYLSGYNYDNSSGYNNSAHEASSMSFCPMEVYVESTGALIASPVPHYSSSNIYLSDLVSYEAHSGWLFGLQR